MHDGRVFGGIPLLLDVAPSTPVMANTIPNSDRPGSGAPISPQEMVSDSGLLGLDGGLVQAVLGVPVPLPHAHNVRLLFLGLS